MKKMSKAIAKKMMDKKMSEKISSAPKKMKKAKK